MPLYIRPATPDDAPALAAVEIASWRAAYGDLMPAAYLAGLSPEAKAEAWRRSLLKYGPAGRKRVSVAVDDDEVVIGFVRAGVDDAEPGIGMVYILYVRPERWGHGAGRKLMETAMEALRDLGLREARLWVLRDNQRARVFYERLGWRADGCVSSADYGGVMLEAECYRRR